VLIYIHEERMLDAVVERIRPSLHPLRRRPGGFTRAGVDDAELSARLQREGTASFDASWKDLLDCLAAKPTMLTQRDRVTTG
jgi:hypothetical protein